MATKSSKKSAPNKNIEAVSILTNESKVETGHEVEQKHQEIPESEQKFLQLIKKRDAEQAKMDPTTNSGGIKKSPNGTVT